MQCRGDEWRGCRTSHSAQRAVLVAGALLKGTSAMPRMGTNILQLPVHIFLFFFFGPSEPATFKSPSQVPTDWAIAARDHVDIIRN